MRVFATLCLWCIFLPLLPIVVQDLGWCLWIISIWSMIIGSLISITAVIWMD